MDGSVLAARRRPATGRTPRLWRLRPVTRVPNALRAGCPRTSRATTGPASSTAGSGWLVWLRVGSLPSSSMPPHQRHRRRRHPQRCEGVDERFEDGDPRIGRVVIGPGRCGLLRRRLSLALRRRVRERRLERRICRALERRSGGAMDARRYSRVRANPCGASARERSPGEGGGLTNMYSSSDTSSHPRGRRC